MRRSKKTEQELEPAEKPVSLKPLTLEQALQGLLAVDPKPIKDSVMRKKKPPRR